MLPKVIIKNGWTKWHFALGLVLTGVALYYSAEAWLNITRLALGNGFATYMLWVPLAAGWLAWVRRERLRLCRPRGTIIGPLTVAIGVLLHHLGQQSAADSLWHLGALVMFVGCLLSVTGIEVFAKFLAAYVVLLFLMPLPNDLSLRFSDLVGSMIWVEPVTALTQDTPDIVAHEVVERELYLIIAVLFVTYAFVFAAPMRWKIRLWMMISSLLVVLCLILLRWMVADWLAQSSSVTVAAYFHLLSGWLALGLACLSLYCIVRLLNWGAVPMREYQQLVMDDL